MDELNELVYDPIREALLDLIRQKVNRKRYLIRQIDADANLTDVATGGRIKAVNALDSELQTLINSVKSNDAIKQRLALYFIKQRIQAEKLQYKVNVLSELLEHESDAKEATLLAYEQYLTSLTRILLPGLTIHDSTLCSNPLTLTD